MQKIHYGTPDWERQGNLGLKVNDERSASEIDRSRILHSAAFRKLAGKTQIFGIGQDPFFRSRLTHSLEVAQIAKGIALKTQADIETCEAAALAHDIGHPPFGHRGEEVLARLMFQHGGFEANAQNFRVLGLLEVKFPDRPGLDLTRAVLDATLKYRQPWDGARRKFYYVDDPAVKGLVEWAMQGFEQLSFEGQAMDWADDVAYSSHDFEDGLHAGLITHQRLRTYQSEIMAHARMKVSACRMADFDFVSRLILEYERAAPRESDATAKRITSRIITQFVGVERRPRTGVRFGTPARHRWNLYVPPSLRRRCQLLKSAAFILLINDPRVASLEARADRVLEALFGIYSADSAEALYPEPFRTRFREAREVHSRARVAADFISGMTDDYAERVYSRIFSGNRAALTDY
jgi:dGTPase